MMIKNRIFGVIIILLVLVICLPNAYGQIFGKNKVQYKDFEWNIIKTPHYDIYYYPGGERLALIAADIAEKAYNKLEKDLRHTPGKRNPIILYCSHNHFKQTNVILDVIGEGTGGFTELFRSRVVLPFTGSYADFEHVLTHELAHVFHVDMLYGNMLTSMAARRALYPVPLWFIEGTAEYFSNPWGNDEDIFMRDAVISGYLIPLQYLEYAGGFIIYKEGQSVLKYIEEIYGYEKVLELNRNLKVSRSFDKALEMTLGVDLEKLNDQWQRWLKRRYWPDFVGKKEPEEFAKKMTDHTEDDSNINMAPTLSPDGDKLVYISDKDQYTNIFLMSAIDGEILATLVEGQTISEFEYVHSFRSQMCWSPDSKYISFTAKAGDQDALFIFDVNEKEIVKRFKFSLDGLYSPTWSPDGKQIVFVGLKDAKSNLYMLDNVDEIIKDDTEDYEIKNLMDDEWDERHPAWSPDGKYLAFSSDRIDGENPEFVNFKYGQYDIFLMDMETHNVRRVIKHKAKDQYPVWLPDGDKIAFVSDRDNSENLYIYNLESDSLTQFTKVLGSILTPSWAINADRLAFSSFDKGGWDVFLLNEPMSLMKEEKDTTKIVDSTVEIPVRKFDKDKLLLDSIKPSFVSSDTGSGDILQEMGKKFKTRKYKVKFEIDALGGGVSYNTIGSFYAMSQINLSDVMGDNRIALGLSAFGNSLKEADAYVYYYYLPNQTDYGIGAFHFKNYYYSNKSIFGEYFEKDMPYSERTYGIDFGLSRPFNRYRRIDFSTRMMKVERQIYEESPGGIFYLDETENMFITQLGLAFVTDNTLWGYTGPVNGKRYYLSLEKTLFSDWDYTTAIAEYRRYIRIFSRHNIAFRLLGAASYGDEAQIFHLGGPETLRGYDYEYVSGSNVGLLNLEYRFPFIDYLGFVAPLPLRFQYIRGVTFFDLGSAWDEDETETWQGIAHDDEGDFYLKDINASWGFGWRMRVLSFVLKFDIGWGTDFSSQTDERYNFSLGAEF
jgi:Tol biopolymer transport system component